MTILVTGGAGFIGSNLVDQLLKLGKSVRVLDDFSTGYRAHLPNAAELIEGDVADQRVVNKAMAGVTLVFHQAAARSVIGSVEHPLATDRANTHGTLTVLKAALDADVQRVVYASSSSVYGVAETLPTDEAQPLVPRSPYAVSKLAGEHYCRVFSELYGLETVALRYFNVYGPRQRPDSAYAAVVPLFIQALSAGERPVVHGDGRQSRDFTFVTDVVDANLAASLAPTQTVSGQVFNVGCGKSHTLLEVLEILGGVMKKTPEPVFTDPRAGDVRRTEADVSAARNAFGFEAQVDIEEGLRRTLTWLRSLLAL